MDESLPFFAQAAGAVHCSHAWRCR